MSHAPLTEIPAATWQKLAGRRIFFGHQSVGYDIIHGMVETMKKDGRIQLPIRRAAPASQEFREKGLAHLEVGTNGVPQSKIDHFVSLMSGACAEADLAFFKFCYVDFNRHTDVARVFEGYRKGIEQARRGRGKTLIGHATVPLVSLDLGVADWAKRLLGRGIKDAAANVKRCAFNELIRKEYGGKEPLFDLAAAESTYPNGKRATFAAQGKECYSLVPAYTRDGGHLSHLGATVVAERFLRFLATSAG